MSALLCFGGPLNEQYIAIPDDQHYLTVLMPPRRLSAAIREAWVDPQLWDAAVIPRQVSYTVDKVAWHDDTACEPRGQHNDRCTWMARCLIAEGYPRHRITDVLNAIGGMTRLLTL